MFSFSVCDHLGNFSDDLTELILKNINQICEDPSEFVEKIIFSSSFQDCRCFEG